MRFFILAAVTVSAAAAVACSVHVGGETNGTHGNAEFSYSNCFLGCTTTTPMMLADEEHVSVSGAIPDSVSIETSAPSIVSIKILVAFVLYERRGRRDVPHGRARRSMRDG